jgi:hypothetical protein
MRAQITLTVNEAKRIIAKGIASLPYVQTALKSGKIFVKGGTTISAVCEELVGQPLRISGRVVPSGTKAPKSYSPHFHCALIERGELSDIFDSLEQAVEGLSAKDVAIIGANAIDAHGNSALMLGRVLGGSPGKIISGLMAEIKNVIIAVGLEKLVPSSIPDIICNTGRKNVDVSMGMAVGLAPVVGKIITEKDAISLIGDVDCLVIGRGGILGAEGATTMIIEGNEEEVDKVFQTVLSVKGTDVSGIEESLRECSPPNEHCKLHRSCIYKKTKRKDKRCLGLSGGRRSLDSERKR